VQALESARVEARLAGAQRLDGGAEALQPRQAALPRLGDAHRVRRHERQPRAAGECLPHAHPGVDPERLGRPRCLADEELAARFWSERGGLLQQSPAPARGDGELESLQKDTDDHLRTHVRIDDARAQALDCREARS
jgi:hypothetical protein